MTAFAHILEKARQRPARIVLPEVADARIPEAALAAVRAGVARPVLPGNPEQLHDSLQRLGATAAECDAIELLDVHTLAAHSDLIDHMVRLRAHRGMQADSARETLLEDPLILGCVLLACEHVEGAVIGAITASAQVVRQANIWIGRAPDSRQLSSFFLLLMPSGSPSGDVVVAADCALVINPDDEQLADIAVHAGRNLQALMDMAPRVAMLSYSTLGSARHSTVSKVARATRIARTLEPDWQIIGEVQLDAAVLPDIFAHKAPGQTIAAPSNVLVFPTLDAGNIGYKLLERFAGATAVGPILQGLTRPLNDLSRGCSVEDIVNILAVTSVQAGAV